MPTFSQIKETVVLSVVLSRTCRSTIMYCSLFIY